MARTNVKNAKQFNYEIAADLVDRFRAFCQERGEAVKDHLEIALQRHLDSPPPPLKPPDPPPLPPMGAPVGAPKKRGRSSKGKS